MDLILGLIVLCGLSLLGWGGVASAEWALRLGGSLIVGGIVVAVARVWRQTGRA